METSFRNWRDRDYAVTALVSTYRSAEFMAECLSDLEGQTAADELEIIVVDAASPENEGEIVRAFQERFDNIRYYRTIERIGVYAAWNLAIREARGEFLATQNTNDRLFPRAHEILLAALRADPEAALAFGDYSVTELPHQPLEGFVESEAYRRQFVWDGYSYEKLLSYCMVGPQPMWRRDAHATHGCFDESFVALGDQEFWLRLGRDRKLVHVPERVGLVWVTPGSLSHSEGASAEEAAIREKYWALFAEDQAERLNRLVQTLESLLAAGRTRQALALYDAERPGFGRMPDMAPIDELFDALRAGGPA